MAATEAVVQLQSRLAYLSLRLHRLMVYVPTSIRSAGLMETRKWTAIQGEARKVAEGRRVAEENYEIAIKNLEAYLSPSELERLS